MLKIISFFYAFSLLGSNTLPPPQKHEVRVDLVVEEKQIFILMRSVRAKVKERKITELFQIASCQVKKKKWDKVDRNKFNLQLSYSCSQTPKRLTLAIKKFDKKIDEVHIHYFKEEKDNLTKIKSSQGAIEL